MKRTVVTANRTQNMMIRAVFSADKIEDVRRLAKFMGLESWEFAHIEDVREWICSH